jgi:hypothetical protein
MEDKRMEHEPQSRGPELAPSAESQESPEAIRIREGIAEALRDGSTIDHETAWLIAWYITPGSGALHDLTATGEITPEIGTQLEIAYGVLPHLADTWIAALDGYCYRRKDKGPVQGWPREDEQ